VPTCPTPVCKIWSPVCASSSDFTSPAGRVQVRLSPAPRSAMPGGRQGPCGLGYVKTVSATDLCIRAGPCLGLRLGQYLPACPVTSAKDRFCSFCLIRKVRAGPTTLSNRSYITTLLTLKEASPGIFLIRGWVWSKSGMPYRGV
jgi:hypothetical protein